MRPWSSGNEAWAAALVALAPSVAAPQWTLQTSGVMAPLRGVSAVERARRVGERLARHGAAHGRRRRDVDEARRDDRPRGLPRHRRHRRAHGVRAQHRQRRGVAHLQDHRRRRALGPQFANEDPKVFLDAMSFWDATHGIAVGDSIDGQFVILMTDDGGRRGSACPTIGCRRRCRTRARSPPAARTSPCSARTMSGSARARPRRRACCGRRSRTDLDSRRHAAASPARSRGHLLDRVSRRPARRRRRRRLRQGGRGARQLRGDADGGATWTLVKEHGLSGFRSVVAYLPGTPGALLAIGPSGSDSRPTTAERGRRCQARAFTPSASRRRRGSDGAPARRADREARRPHGFWNSASVSFLNRMISA